MKQTILTIAAALLLMGCATTVHQQELYGTVTDIVTAQHKGCQYRLKVWCNTDGRYYTVYTYERHQIGSYIRIK